MTTTIFDTRLAGIPCQIKVIHFKRIMGSYRQDAQSDLDYNGFSEYDYQVLDRRGRPAPWLSRKIKQDEIDARILGYFEEW